MSEPWDIPMSATYDFMQKADCCSDSDMEQSLTVKIDDGGGGVYAVLKTERWAIDKESLPRFVAMLERCLAGQTGMRDFFNEGDGKEATEP